jgi:hypothetical protein
MIIELLPLCQLCTEKIRCNILAISVMMILRVEHGEFVNWATIMYSQLV